MFLGTIVLNVYKLRFHGYEIGTSNSYGTGLLAIT